MPTSMQDIANKANVSTMTVSRVIRGHDSGIADATRERVLAAARDLDYVSRRPSPKRRRTQTYVIGVIPSYRKFEDHPVDMFTYNGMVSAARENLYDLLWVLRDEDHWRGLEAESPYPNRDTDGFVFISLVPGEWKGALESLVANGVKAAVCYRRDVPAGVAWIDPDNAAIATLALDYLYRNGHRRIAYFALPNTFTVQRMAASPTMRSYDDLARERMLCERANAIGDGVCITTIDAVTPSFDLVPDVLDQLVKHQATAVIAVDMVSIMLLNRLKVAGWAVPGDISVLGIDGMPMSETVGLSSIAFDFRSIGEYAVQAVLDQRRGSSALEASRVVPVKLIKRRSVGVPISS